ncbi:hypothetical protein WDU94_014134 [Cyamophila willieti]
MDYESLLSGRDFKDVTVRQAFVRKVYSILMVQLAITAAIIGMFLFKQGLKEFVLTNIAFFWTMNLLAFFLLMMLACYQELRRSYPLNFIFLSIFTIVQGITLGSVTVFFDAEQILYAVAITAIICLAITIFAFQTALVVIFFPSKTLVFLMGCAGAVLFSLYLLYDTQLMIGGQHQYNISPEEYIFAALNLYVDIIQIFLSILQIMSSSQE